MVVRGCGVRVQGGIYAEVATSPDGRPIEEFLVEPPIPVPPDVGLPARGVILVEDHRRHMWLPGVDGLDMHTPIWNIVDRIGSTNYPNVADIVEETRAFGGSRRLPPTLDFSKLTEFSQLWWAHDRADIENYADYYPHLEHFPYCRKRNIHHKAVVALGPSGPREYYQGAEPGQLDHNPGSMCVGLWWEDLDPLTVSQQVTFFPGLGNEHGGYLRVMPAFGYCGRRRPEGVTPRYRLALFARLPLARIVVVRGEGFNEAMERASAAQILVEEVDE
jgi:hypothetical protein